MSKPLPKVPSKKTASEQHGAVKTIFAISDKVEIPKIKRTVETKYPFGDLEQGHSFLIPTDQLTPAMEKATMIAQLGNGWAKRHGLPNKYLSRRMEDGVRCWRIDGTAAEGNKK